MPKRMVQISGVVVLLIATAACATEAITTVTESPTIDAPTTQVTDPPGPRSPFPVPPPVRVTGDGVDLSLTPWTYCWTELGEVGGCADGLPPTEPQIARGAGPLEIDFPVDGWGFEVSYTPTGDPAAVISVPVTTPEGELLVRPDATTTFDVTLMGRSAPGAAATGDLFVTFRWEP